MFLAYRLKFLKTSFFHVFSLKGCAQDCSAWKTQHKGAASFFFSHAALIFIFVSLLAVSLPLAFAQGSITIDKETYAVDETVRITLVNATPNDALSIISDQDVFKYSGELENELQFYPRETGDYIVRLSNDEIIDEAAFQVVENYVTITSNPSVDLKVYTDKKEYLVNEPVLIHVNATEEYDLAVITETEVFKYLGLLNELLPFIPQYAGVYKVELRKDFLTIATTEFSVVEQVEQITNQSINLTVQNTSNVSNISNVPNAQNTSQEIPSQEATTTPTGPAAETITGNVSVPESPETAGIDEIGGELAETEPAEEEQLSINLPAKLELKDKAGTTRIPSMQVLRETGDAYDVELFPEKSGISNIKLNGLKIISDKNLLFDEVSLKRDEVKKEFKDKNVIRSFFIDASELNFTNGTITSTAAGKELWKCREWNSTLNTCLGRWEKIMDLKPGEEYSIILEPGDPAYAETGVASINTKKPIYYPGESAEIIIVVLDATGHLVRDADVSLAITAPGNTTSILTTSNNSIIETSIGIYEAVYPGISQEGSYELFVNANGRNVNSSMQSSFEAKSYYEFDIIRSTPVTTDPWKGAFDSSISLVSHANTGTSLFDFTEILPANFEITNTGGSTVSTNGNKTSLTWTGLSNNSVVSYSAKPPLVTPDLYELGPSFISYDSETSNIFFEARPWYLAVDPLTSNLTPNADGSYTTWTIGGTAPAATRWQSVDDPPGSPDTTATYIISPLNANRNSFMFQSLGVTQATIRWVAVRVHSRRAAATATLAIFYRQGGTDYDNANVQSLTNTWTLYSLAGWNYTTNPATSQAWNLSTINSMEWGVRRSAGSNRAWVTQMYVTVGYSLVPNITNLTFPANNSVIASTSIVNFSFNVTDDENPVANCTLWGNFTGSWAANKTVYNSEVNNITNISLALPDGTYLWNIQCIDNYSGSGFYKENYTVLVEYNKPPRKTIVNIDQDASEPWNTTNRNPYINVSLNKDGTCRLSKNNESFADMSNDYNCTGAGTSVSNCTYTGTILSIGTTGFFIACNDTRGNADTNATNLYFTLDVLCDSHSDCTSGEYCDYTQQCHPDELAGYPCNTQAYTGLEWDEVCGDGANSYCVNDSSYYFNGWYCTGTATDCVYNDQGKSFSLGETLCNSSNNDYKNCSLNNQWGSTFDCGDLYDPYNQSATYHAGGYCNYYATAQSCINGTTGGCSGPATSCSGHIYNQTTTACGSLIADCDLGCGAGCDPGNSTTPGILSGICYYDKSCSNACAWSQSSEEAPEFCINDNNGGTCAYSTRTSPANSETCYWSAACLDGSGASLASGAADNLRADYCDYCNAAGNQTGQYSPAPNASCYSGCANSGTIYYDNGGTPGDRSDDCDNGVTTIMSDALSIGDAWNGSAAAYCNDTECTDDCGSLVGTCIGGEGGVCICTDNDNPELIILGPSSEAWDNDGTIDFTYTVNDTSSGIENCSLIINSSINMTNSSIDENVDEQIFTQSLANGTYNWSIICYDNSSNYNMNQVAGMIAGVDTTDPQLSNPNINGTNFDVNQKICLNITASDTYSGIAGITAYITIPGIGTENVALTDTSTTSCDQANGNGIYSGEYTLVYSGTHNWSSVVAIDAASNSNTIYPGLTWNVSSGGIMNVAMTQPTANLEINESEYNYWYLQNCTVQCIEGGVDCEDVYLWVQFNNGSGYKEITTDTTQLISSLDNYSCGNLSAPVAGNCSPDCPTEVISETNAYSLSSAQTQVDLDLGQAYDLSKTFIVARYDGQNDTSNMPTEEAHTISFLDADTIRIRRGSTGSNGSRVSYSVTQAENIRVCPFTNSWATDDTNDDVDISSCSYSLPSEYNSKCFVEVLYNTMSTSSDADCHLSTKILANITSQSNVNLQRYTLDDAGACGNDGTATTQGYVVCFIDNTTVTTGLLDNADIEDGYTIGIGHSVNQSTSFLTFNYMVSDSGLEQDTVRGKISSTTQLEFSRNIGETTDGSVSLRWYVIEFEPGKNAYVEQLDYQDLGTTAKEIDADFSQSYDTNKTLLMCTGNFDAGEGNAFPRVPWTYYFLDSNTVRTQAGMAGTASQNSEHTCQAIIWPNTTSYETGSSGGGGAGGTPGQSCSYTFNISSEGNNVGNNTWPIRCKATSSNSATASSNHVNLTINDRPYANIINPTSDTWLTGIININASLSFDSDGSIANYLFEYDNNTAFSSPSTICNSASSNCTWNTTAQSQCSNNTMGCYLRLTVRDNDGLSNSTYIILGFDTQGPTTILAMPRNFENISTGAFTAMAASSDDESGMHTVIFEYRENSLAAWKPACNDTTLPYECEWNLETLSDGNTYEFRAYANDSLGNIGGADSHTNITIDRAGPVINLESPENNIFTANNTVMLYYNATDTYSNIANCSLIINSILNQSNTTITQSQSQNFTLVLGEGTYNWSINCTDVLGNTNASATRNITIDNTGPVTLLDRPPDYAQITGASYTVNASAIDQGTGNISTIAFEYRENNTAEWKFICNDDRGPTYDCLWDLTGLEDGTTYEVRSWANDTLGNNGSYSTHTGIAIDNDGPSIYDVTPSEGAIDADGNITFSFKVNDVSSSIANCSLIINGSINQTNSSISEDTESYFYLYNQDDKTFNWSIECWDNFSGEGHMGSTGNISLTIQILYTLRASVTSMNGEYEKGNQESETINLTTATTDYVNASIDASVITDIIATQGESRNIWWDTAWKYRTRSTINETYSIDRESQWVHLSFTLDPDCLNLAHRNSLRLVRELTAIPEFNEWNVSYCADTNYIRSLWVSFRLNLSANASTNIYIYFDNSTSMSKTSTSRGPMRMIWVSAGGSGNAPGAATIRSDLSSALGALGLDYTTFYSEVNTNAASTDLTFANISGYAIAYYDSGAKYGNSLDSTEGNTLFQFVNQSGNLFLTGQDLGYDANADGWIYNAAFGNLTRVSAGWVDNANPSTFTIAASHPVTQYIGSLGATVSVAGDYEDGYTTLAGSTSVRILNWTGSATPTSGTANYGLTDPGCSGFCGKTVYYSGVFYISATQGIQSSSARSAFLRGAIEWFLNNDLTEAKGVLEQWVARNSTGSTGTNGIWSWLSSATELSNGSYQAVSQASKPGYNNATAWAGFNITLDNVGPIVNLQDPGDGAEANSSVTFAFYVNDTLSTVNNCSLIIDDQVEESDDTILEGPNYFYPRIPLGGWHNWSVNCTDYYGNIGVSEKWEIYIKPPDLAITSSNIIFSNSSPKEGDNITINATVFNLGGSDAQNVIIQIFLGDPDSGGTQLGNNFTFNITEVTGSQSNATIGITWVTPGPGPFEFYVVVDPPTTTNGSIFELNETNNKAKNTVNIPAYNYFHGSVESNIYLGDFYNQSIYFYTGAANVTGNIFVTDEASSISFSSVQALGRDVNNNTASNDFSDLDAALNTTGYNDSIRKIWTENTDIPVATKSIAIFNRQVNNIPVINSTSASSFITGILWDTSDGGTQYNGTQDILFITQINESKTGGFGTYDYEIRLPANLRTYHGSETNVEFYSEMI